MTRSTLLRVALGCAGLLGCAVLGAGIGAFGIHNTLVAVTACTLGGAAASLGWHGIARLFERPEPRHRADRPEGGIRQRPQTPGVTPPPPVEYTPPQTWPRGHGVTRAEAEELDAEFAEPQRTRKAYVDPYPDRLDDEQWPGPDADTGEDLYAHPGQQAAPWA